jgi:hypothetical protein
MLRDKLNDMIEVSRLKDVNAARRHRLLELLEKLVSISPLDEPPVSSNSIS